MGLGFRCDFAHTEVVERHISKGRTVLQFRVSPGGDWGISLLCGGCCLAGPLLGLGGAAFSWERRVKEGRGFTHSP